MMSINFTVHTVNIDQSIWMISLKNKNKKLMNEVKSTDLLSKSLKSCVKYSMRLKQITEASPLTVEGSFTPDLLISKLWLWEELSRVLDRLDIQQVNAVYVLGSWTGSVGMVLAAKHFPADTIINVDSDPNWISMSREIAQDMGFSDRTQHMIKDANSIDYRQARSPSVVINTSTNDIVGRDWFDNIPPGTVVVLQGRDATITTQSWDSLSEFESDWPMRQILFRGQLPLQDPETKYHRYMIIGQR
jgi:precorrin-6B methylase 2